MQQHKKVFGNIFLSTAVLGILFLVIEIIFQSFGKSACQTEGCKLAAQYVRFDDISILLIGLLTFTVLALLSFMTLYRNGMRFDSHINLILIVSLGAEGFFTGYQVFRLHNVCALCLITFGLFLILGISRILYGEKEVIAGFLSCAGIFALFYLVLPAGAAVHLPEDEIILFYGKDCKYCTEVLKEIETSGIKVVNFPVGEYADFLKNMGIEHVPTLYVNGKNRKIFLTGKEAIDRYLFCGQAEVPEKGLISQEHVHTRKKTGYRTDILTEETNNRLVLQDISTDFYAKPDDNGMCKEADSCR